MDFRCASIGRTNHWIVFRHLYFHFIPSNRFYAMIMFLRTLTEAGITPETQREDALEIRATNMMTTYLSLLVYPLVVFSYVQFPDKSYWIQLFILASLY